MRHSQSERRLASAVRHASSATVSKSSTSNTLTQPHYHAPSLLIAAQASRSAPQNLAAAIQLLHATIVQAGRGLVRGQTSAAQKERVRSLAQADKRRTREMKERHKSKKAGRRE